MSHQIQTGFYVIIAIIVPQFGYRVYFCMKNFPPIKIFS